MDLEFKEEFRKPLTNIKKKDGNYILRIEMPGLHKEQIDVELAGEVLEVSGQKKEYEYQKGLSGFIRREFRGPIYHREFQIPKDVDKTEIKAKMRKGVLIITIPIKQRESKKKVISLR